MHEAVIEVESVKTGVVEQAAYEHPWVVRFCHWLNSVALLVMIASGFQIFRAFPSFGAKIPQKDLLHWPRAFALGGWLGGGLQWHLSFVWIYVGTGLFYLGYQVFSGNYRQVLFTPSDIRGVWPMVHYYFFFGPKPAAREVYNPLQKLAYTSVLGLGLLSVLTGIAVWKPVQFSWLAWMMGGFHWARIWHFAVMWAILFFLLGHLIMVALHGWSNFTSMLTGWKKNPEYLVGTNLPGQDILDEDLPDQDLPVEDLAGEDDSLMRLSSEDLSAEDPADEGLAPRDPASGDGSGQTEK